MVRLWRGPSSDGRLLSVPPRGRETEGSFMPPLLRALIPPGWPPPWLDTALITSPRLQQQFGGHDSVYNRGRMGGSFRQQDGSGVMALSACPGKVNVF